MHTYKEYLDAGGERILPEKSRRAKDDFDVICACGNYALPALVWDVSGLDSELTGGQNWACDDCWLKWMREMRQIDPGYDFITPEEWFYKFVQKIGRASLHVMAQHEANMLESLGRVRKDIDRELKMGIGNTEDLQAKRNKIQERVGISTLQIDKLSIVANNTDSATLTGIPAGSTVEVESVQYAVNDGTLVLRVNAPGQYVLKVNSPNKLPEEVIVNAS